MADEVREIELKRYAEIAKQRATYGPEAPAHVQMEYAAFYERYGPLELIDKPRLLPERRRELDLDVKFLIGQINSLTVRQGTLERGWSKTRWVDWAQLILLTALIVIVLLIARDVWF